MPSKYEVRLAAQLAANREAQFRMAYPPATWATMTPAEQATARATWTQADRATAAAQRSGDRTRNTLLWIFIGVPVILVVVLVVAHRLFGGL